ncbi:MAG TPA: HAD family hydrolase [Gemmataceae bacterium]|nr:HAD family hydrolase [Gemmataceae bacterium]
MRQAAHDAIPVRGVVFDLDGTLVVQELDFEAMRREIGLPTGTPLLEALERMGGPARAAAEDVLRRHELAAAETARLTPGVAAFLDHLAARGIRRAVLSRNMRVAVEKVLRRCGVSVDLVLAREDAPYKPSPEGLWRICAAWGLAPAEVLMVGDYLYDLQAGRGAGTRTALVTHGRDLPFAALADVAFASFEDLPEQIRRWLP